MLLIHFLLTSSHKSSKFTIFACLQQPPKQNHYKSFMYQQIQSTLQQLLGDEQAFYAFRQPGEEGLQLSTIQAAEPFDYGFLERSSKESGFVMFPFSQKKEQGWWFTGEPFQ